MTYQDYRAAIERLGVHPALGPIGAGYGIEQNPHELATFLSLVPTVNKVLEIGTGYRAGLARFMSEFMGWYVTTIDRNIPITPAPLARQITGSSDSRAVIEHVRGEYDLVIIDGDHSYAAVRCDFENYQQMGRIVMFHDIVGDRGCEGARDFWELISLNWGNWQFMTRHEVVAQGEQRAGIGWLVR